MDRRENLSNFPCFSEALGDHELLDQLDFSSDIFQTCKNVWMFTRRWNREKNRQQIFFVDDTFVSCYWVLRFLFRIISDLSTTFLLRFLHRSTLVSSITHPHWVKASGLPMFFVPFDPPEFSLTVYWIPEPHILRHHQILMDPPGRMGSDPSTLCASLRSRALFKHLVDVDVCTSSKQTSKQDVSSCRFSPELDQRGKQNKNGTNVQTFGPVVSYFDVARLHVCIIRFSTCIMWISGVQD